MRAFVTVGSTRFDALVQRALSDAVLDVLRTAGYSTVIVQCGNSDFDTGSYTQNGESWTRALEGGGAIEVWRFKASLDEEYKQADLVISHAGSGTILDVLRLQKPLIVVPNSTLLDDHQQELATALAGLGHVWAATVPSLPQTITTLDPSTLVPFPKFDGSRFRELLDEEMGFALET
ncbi:glycosyltransferase family 1 protein [Phanerochaete carnosa HHB-10118-sp]|uniref:UDP-N-acetylglucosamine transferase subunit ALG13 n=1 Tax=Phanerochaete carnosa (strain HHB-10118-sp) TaxID=650164 RepID=K5W8R7_PHACS|nr:glycosyltransferase family 1 protein [Phanerochaete carnosa HHB-10118-sp]EKM55600.1 glycosyltransferase family 1 protein [Phanerochaete carnosa HHB-10118-sp]